MSKKKKRFIINAKDSLPFTFKAHDETKEHYSRTKHILDAELPCLVQDETQTVIHVLLLWFNVGANSSWS